MTEHGPDEGVQLAGAAVGFLVSGEAVPDEQLLVPWQAVERAGGRPLLVAPAAGAVKLSSGRRLDGAAGAGEVAVGELGGLVVAGGAANVVALRAASPAVDLVARALRAGRPVATVLEGAGLLLESGALRGQTLAASEDLRDEVMASGATWVDRAVMVDHGLVTCGDGGVLDGFAAAVVAAVAAQAAQPT